MAGISGWRRCSEGPVGCAAVRARASWGDGTHDARQPARYLRQHRQRLRHASRRLPRRLQADGQARAAGGTAHCPVRRGSDRGEGAVGITTRRARMKTYSTLRAVPKVFAGSVAVHLCSLRISIDRVFRRWSYCRTSAQIFLLPPAPWQHHGSSRTATSGASEGLGRPSDGPSPKTYEPEA